ncbi:MAG: hydrolase [Bdellovibrio sp.]|nr:hydrolase [Bdellovibrio sp.]
MQLAVFLLVSLSATPLGNRAFHKYVVVWNIGQGQWVTATEENHCQHFDLGGEKFPWKNLKRLCSDKENRFSLSHWDWDHIGALAKWPSSWKACINLRPLGKSSPRKMKILAQFQDCSSEKNFKEWSPQNAKETNSRSHVVRYEDYLLPGDSPVAEERFWQNIYWITSARVLVLGHHGSRTSTSTELLTRLPKLKMAIASARWARYKHPHAEVMWRLKKAHVPLLRTEDWGNIWFGF